MQSGGKSCALVGVEEMLASCSTNYNDGRCDDGGSNARVGVAAPAFPSNNDAAAVTYFVRMMTHR